MAELRFRHDTTDDQLEEVLNDFSFAVSELNEYEKLNYQCWRVLNRMRGVLLIKWSYPSALSTAETAEIDICETEGVAPQAVHLLANDGSFGEFLYNRLLTRIEKWCQQPILAVNPNNATVSVADSANSWNSIEDTWMDKLAVKAEAYDLEQANAAIEKLCESAALAAPMNTNHTNNKENNVMNFNFDFGPVNPALVRMSMYGLAVKNKAGTWVSYNSNGDEIVDVDVLNFDGAKFLYRMPVAIKDITVGDVVIHNSAPMFVVSVPKDGKTLTVVDTINGERKDIMLPRSPFGFNFATKVVNFLGNMMTGANADNPFGNMWMLMAMSGEGKDMNDILPFLMVNNATAGMDNNMLMFMALSNTKDGSKDMLPWLLMSQTINAAPAHECKCGGNCSHAPSKE
jgi:hypothetical protein